MDSRNPGIYQKWYTEILKECMGHGSPGLQMYNAKRLNQEELRWPVEPKRTDRDPDNNNNLIYAATPAGTSKFNKDYEKYDKEFTKFKDSAQLLYSFILKSIGPDVETAMENIKLSNHARFADMDETLDIIKLVKMAEECASGRGNHTIMVYLNEILELKMTPGSGANYQEYYRKFSDNHSNIMRMGTHQEILTKIFDCLFILGLDREMFQQEIKDILKLPVWPHFSDLAGQLLTSTITSSGVKTLFNNGGGKDSSSGSDLMLTANAAVKDDPRTCYNCGIKGHTAILCKKDKAFCDNCGDKVGHMTRRNGGNGGSNTNYSTNNNNFDTRKPSGGGGRGNPRGGSNNSMRSSNSSGGGGRHNTSHGIRQDTACRGGHVLQHPEMLVNPRPSSQSIAGISSARIQSTARGSLPGGLLGTAFCVPNATGNLLSVHALIKNGGYFKGDEKSLHVYDAKGHLLVSGVNTGTDFWSVRYGDLESHSSNPTISTSLTPLAVNQVFGNSVTALSKYSLVQTAVPSPTHFSTEERTRAREAFELCSVLAHPGDSALSRLLDGNNLPNCHLTSRDLRHARLLFGPCPACIEGKMIAPKTPTSTTEPARSIGEVLHCDILLLPDGGDYIGGYKGFLFCVDEKSGFIAMINIRSKTSAEILRAFKDAIGYFNQFGHKVVKVFTDDETVFRSVQPQLAFFGVTLSTYPAGLHEKRAERFVRTFKERKNATKCQLSYKIPSKLEVRLSHHVVTLLNSTPNSSTGSLTPVEMVIGKKPMLGNFYFGQIGLFHSVRQDSPTQRAEWGIFVGYQDYFTRHLIAYMPTRGSMYSKRKFVPMNSIPLEWHLQPRTHPQHTLSSTTPINPAAPILNTIIPSRNVLIQSGTPIIPSSVVTPSDG
eukprot:gene35879-46576_t